MNPALIALILSLVEEVAKVAPELITSLQNIFSKSNPTPADWQAERAAVLSKRYEDFAPPIPPQ